MIQTNNTFFFFYKNFSDLEIHPASVEHAYLAILSDDLHSASCVFSTIDSPRAKWGRVLVDIIKDKCLNIYPTFFQIRNFYEIDLDFLLKNRKIDYVENLLGALDIFSNINQEIYKFTARVMFENKLYSAALKYMELSKKEYYNDPELHFMLANYYKTIKNYDSAYYYMNECIKFLPSYYPAVQLKKQIEEIIF